MEQAKGLHKAGEISVDIPGNALIACPLVRFELRSPRDCVPCSHCLGFADRYPGSLDLPFHRRFSIMCRGEVKQRQAMIIAVG